MILGGGEDGSPDRRRWLSAPNPVATRLQETGVVVIMFCGAQAKEATDSMLDPRSVCNLILDIADAEKTSVDPVSLQKLLYFSHGLYLLRTGKPLVSGYFEAWKNGPVHPGVYHAFKIAGSGPIGFRVKHEDLLTGDESSIPNPTDAGVIDLVRRVVISYGSMDTGRLVALSHAPGAPWEFVASQAQNSMALGMRIPDKIIVERFFRHKVSVGDWTALGDPREDTPFA
jgi:uncharacterized phage-associated protein